MEPDAIVRTTSALLGEEVEVADSFLHAAVYARAIRTGETPRNIVEALYKALPSSDAWPALRESLRAVLEEEEEGTGDT